MHPFTFAGQQFVALPQGALLWLRRRAIIVADLHFEKASWFAGHGQFLPPYDSQATLAGLAALIDAHNPREIWCLGDSFHDAAGKTRLPDEARALLDRMALGRDWYWIVGNHDFDAEGMALAEAVVDGILLRHEADTSDGRSEISGHYHPKFGVTVKGRRIARRCFVAGSHKLILPAFGALTGGLDARHAEIRRIAGPEAEALIPLPDRLLRFRIAA